MLRIFMYSFIFTQVARYAGVNSIPIILYTGIVFAYFLMVRWFPVFPYNMKSPNDYNYYNGDEE